MSDSRDSRAKRSSKSPVLQKAALSIIVIFFFTSMVISIYNLRVGKAEIRESIVEYPLWAATQLDTEFWRFRTALTNYTTSTGQVDKEMYLTRLDILWSRVNVYSANSFAWKFLSDAKPAIKTVADLKQVLNAYDERLINLKPGNLQFYTEFIHELDRLSPRIRETAIVTNTEMVRVRKIQKETWLGEFDTVMSIMFVTVIVGILLIYNLYRQLLQGRQLTTEVVEAEQLILETKDLAVRDPLTNLFNRRYLGESLTREIKSADRHKSSIGIMVIDVDHFKKFNDEYGHDAGDYVLQRVADLLFKLTRGEDIPCRYGGEEFVIILPGADLETTEIRALSLLERMRELHLEFDNNYLGKISSSIGIAVFPHHGLSGEALIKSADKALYFAKSNGRDQVQACPGKALAG